MERVIVFFYLLLGLVPTDEPMKKKKRKSRIGQGERGEKSIKIQDALLFSRPDRKISSATQPVLGNEKEVL